MGYALKLLATARRTTGRSRRACTPPSSPPSNSSPARRGPGAAPRRRPAAGHVVTSARTRWPWRRHRASRPNSTGRSVRRPVDGVARPVDAGERLLGGEEVGCTRASTFRRSGGGGEQLQGVAHLPAVGEVCGSRLRTPWRKIWAGVQESPNAIRTRMASLVGRVDRVHVVARVARRSPASAPGRGGVESLPRRHAGEDVVGGSVDDGRAEIRFAARSSVSGAISGIAPPTAAFEAQLHPALRGKAAPAAARGQAITRLLAVITGFFRSKASAISAALALPRPSPRSPGRRSSAWTPRPGRRSARRLHSALPREVAQPARWSTSGTPAARESTSRRSPRARATARPTVPTPNRPMRTGFTGSTVPHRAWAGGALCGLRVRL